MNPPASETNGSGFCFESQTPLQLPNLMTLNCLLCAAVVNRFAR